MENVLPNTLFFPRDVPDPIPLIAPIGANIRSLTVNYSITEDPDVLQQVVNMISSRNSNLSDYQPSLAVVLNMEADIIGVNDHVSLIEFMYMHNNNYMCLDACLYTGRKRTL